MAKRRRLETPSAADIDKIEAEFRRETPGPTSTRPSLNPPIAQVAGQAAAQADPLPADTRAKIAQADRFEAAEKAGLVMQDIPLDQIDASAMIRDRTQLDPSEMTELRASIERSGLRLPIEIFPLDTPKDGMRYGLLSGYRRLRAMEDLRALNGAGGFDRIKAIVRPAQDTADAFAAMVEENEIRAQLSHFERGRIAVIATKNGAFSTVEDAVTGMFPVASKAKRSKIRSFALIFEELGDMLLFPETIRERDGLRLAVALRDGAVGGAIRAALSDDPGTDAETEWQRVETVLTAAGPAVKDRRLGGRPAAASKGEGGQTVTLPNGIAIRREATSSGHVIRLQGAALTDEMMEDVMGYLERFLGVSRV